MFSKYIDFLVVGATTISKGIKYGYKNQKTRYTKPTPGSND